ncbi:MAG: hypothetical protein ACKVT2_12725 [Saprospiraceae bacterium]
MNRNILLVEPNYANKYPPIGLMKIATYHRMLGDNVRFFKGDLRDLVVDTLCEECLERLSNIDSSVAWRHKQQPIRAFIKNKKSHLLDELEIENNPYYFLVLNCLTSFAEAYKKKTYLANPQWDRVYVTTLFTFYWKITVEAIEFSKRLVKSLDQLFVGGVLASLLHEELKAATGIEPMQGLLDKPGMLGDDNNIIIDDLPLDYSILEETDYNYPTQSAYFTFMTKGCTRKCAFCSVPILEPTYKSRVAGTTDKFEFIKDRFGEQQNLLLMDNNVLASPNFADIVEEIKAMGFVKGAMYTEPNQLAIAVRNLRDGYNDRAYLKRSHRLLNDLIKRVKGKSRQLYYDTLAHYQLLRIETVTKKSLLDVYPLISEIYEKYRFKQPKQRFVDFNQGTDCRYVTEELMQKMSEIPIRPLRIAFDYIGLKKQYVAAIELAAKYGIEEMSNYILYNFKDKPEDFYNRLEVNVELCERLGVHIYSFPMKYIPLFKEEAKDRNFIGDHWNRKYIRAIQSVLNVTKGIVAPGRSFFQKAFGKNLNEFREILLMPETFIIYRYFFEFIGKTHEWREALNALNAGERLEAESLILSNNFTAIEDLTKNPKIQSVLKYYTIRREDIEIDKAEYSEMKKAFDDLIKSDPFKKLTLTYDFESAIARSKHQSLIPV